MVLRTTIIDKVDAENVDTVETLLNSAKNEPLIEENNAFMRMRDYNILVWNFDQSNDLNVFLETLKDFVGLADADTNAVATQDALTALNATNFGVSQSVTGTGKKLHKVQWYIKKTLVPTGPMVCKLYSHSGVFGTSSVPGTLLATSEPVDASEITTSLALVDFFFEDKGIQDDQKYTLVNATKYVITLEYADGSAVNFVSVGHDASSPGHAGNPAVLTTVWTENAAIDMVFVLITEGTLEWLPLTAAAAVGTASGSAASQAAVKQYSGNSPYLAIRLRAIKAANAVSDVDALFVIREQ